jgi:hypothetical protein
MKNLLLVPWRAGKWTVIGGYSLIRRIIQAVLHVQTGLPVVISFLALIVSTTSFYLTMKTTSLQNRPYVGIVKTPDEIISDPTTRNGRSMRWDIVFKNTGSIPAWLKVEERKCYVIFNNEIIDCGIRDPFPTIPVGVFLMSQGTGTLQGGLTDPAIASRNVEIFLDDVLSGKVPLIEHLRVSYQPSATLSQGWFGKILGLTDEYIYEVELRFVTHPAGISPSFQPYFAMTTIKAD